MPLRPALLAEIKQALGAALSPSLTAGSACSDLYEAYLFTLVLEAAKTEGASVVLRSIDSHSPKPFVFRTSPGFIGSRTQNYGYAVIRFPDCPILEAHLGIRVSGHSGVLHELDISVLLQDEATLCRSSADRVAPRSHKVMIAIEAKYYTTDVALGLGRGFLGLTRDLSAHNAFFAINRTAPSAERLLTHKGQKWEHRVIPTDPVAVERLRNAFQKAFRNFVTTYGP